MRPFTDSEKALAQLLFELGAIKFGSFTLKLHEKFPDAPKSPIYLNLRDDKNPKEGKLNHDCYRRSALAMMRLAANHSLRYDLIVGLPNAGTPFAEAFARLLIGEPKDHLFDLKKEERDGKRCIVTNEIGNKLQGKRCLLIDDLISGADTKIEAKRALEGLGAKASDILVLVDRCQGGVETMAHESVRTHAVFTLPELINFYVENGSIPPEKELEVLNYLQMQLRTV